MSSDEDDDDVAQVDAEEIDDEDDENTNYVAVADAAVEVDDEDDDAVDASVQGDDEDDEEEVTNVKKSNNTETKVLGGKKRKKPCPPVGKKIRQPAVMGLTIPFRATKRTMKLDPDIATIQNEAAILTTLAAELFVKRLATASNVIAKSRGRNTIRYEDLAEARTKDQALSFLTTILP